MKRKQMTYSELLERVKDDNLTTQWEVATWLIGYQKVVTEADWVNIMKLYAASVID